MSMTSDRFVQPDAHVGSIEQVAGMSLHAGTVARGRQLWLHVALFLSQAFRVIYLGCALYVVMQRHGPGVGIAIVAFAIIVAMAFSNRKLAPSSPANCDSADQPELTKNGTMMMSNDMD